MNKKTKTWNAPEGYFTRQETMVKLGISSSTLHRIVQEGNFIEDGETIRFRGKRLYRKDAVDKYFTGLNLLIFSLKIIDHESLYK